LWTAEHLTLHSRVAIKLLDDELLARPDAVARFVREARAAAQIRSPHIVQILDVGVEQGVPFIAMELLQGESLAERLDRVGTLTPRDTTRILTQVARGLSRAHAAGLVHRDLNPSNIFLERNEEEENAKVLDFGVAKALVPGFDTESGATRTGVLIGSPHYMSPEQAEASELLDQRTDVWAFGVVAFECLTGRRPFDQVSLGSQLLSICAWPMPIPSQVAEVPVGFDAWFAKTCARPLAERYGSAHDAAHELRLVCENPATTGAPRADSSQSQVRLAALNLGAPRAVEPAPSTRPAWVDVGRRWQTWAAVALVLGLLALGLALRSGREPLVAPLPAVAEQRVPDTVESPALKPVPPPSAAEGRAPAGVVAPTVAPERQAPLAPAPSAVPKFAPKTAPKGKARGDYGMRPVTIPLPPFKEDPY
jgi:serine/threonine protein kinase